MYKYYLTVKELNMNNAFQTDYENKQDMIYCLFSILQMWGVNIDVIENTIQKMTYIPTIIWSVKYKKYEN